MWELFKLRYFIGSFPLLFSKVDVFVLSCVNVALFYLGSLGLFYVVDAP